MDKGELSKLYDDLPKGSLIRMLIDKHLELEKSIDKLHKDINT